MPRFFFDFDDTGKQYPDTEGTDLDHFDAAKDDAVSALVEMAKDVLADGAYRELTYKVRNEHGRQLMLVGIKFELKTSP